MTIEEIETLIDNSSWFENLGEPLLAEGYIQIPSLYPWAGIPTSDDQLERLADLMDWLPTTRDQEDPIHGRSLEERSEQLGKHKEHAQRSRSVYKRTLASLRSFEAHPSLKIGPHDFSEAARGAAAYASRKAAYETMLGESGTWCELMNLYKIGRWPCGIMPSGMVVVL